MTKETKAANTDEAIQGNALISWEEAMAAKAAEQQKQKAMMSQGPKFLAFKGAQLLADDVPIPGNKTEVIVLCFAGENAWYPGRFDPTKPQTPACWSVYTDAANMIPNDNSKDMQHENCVDCPKYQWSSDPLGGRGKACKNRYRIAVIPATVSSAEDVATAEMRLATLPVTSGPDFEKFMNEAQITFQRPIFGVTAELSVVADPKTQFKVFLKPIMPVPGSLILAVLDRIKVAEKEILYAFAADTESEPAKKLKE